jgi:hypothetical protein
MFGSSQRCEDSELVLRLVSERIVVNEADADAYAVEYSRTLFVIKSIARDEDSQGV